MGLNSPGPWFPGLMQEIGRVLGAIAANPAPVLLILTLVVAIQLAALALPREDAPQHFSGSRSVRQRLRALVKVLISVARSARAPGPSNRRMSDAEQ